MTHPCGQYRKSQRCFVIKLYYFTNALNYNVLITTVGYYRVNTSHHSKVIFKTLPREFLECWFRNGPWKVPPGRMPLPIQSPLETLQLIFDTSGGAVITAACKAPLRLGGYI